jgi:hypothetical protein
MPGCASGGPPRDLPGSTSMATLRSAYSAALRSAVPVATGFVGRTVSDDGEQKAAASIGFVFWLLMGCPIDWGNVFPTPQCTMADADEDQFGMCEVGGRPAWLRTNRFPQPCTVNYECVDDRGDVWKADVKTTARGT